MSSDNENEAEEPAGLDRRKVQALLVLTIIIAGLGTVFLMNRNSNEQKSLTAISLADPIASGLPPARQSRQIRVSLGTRATNVFDSSRRFLLCWDAIPPSVAPTTIDTGTRSNIRLEDYAGAATCAECHARNFQQWSNHPHRWMNALATERSVKGDFTGDQVIHYLGGTGTFKMEGEEFRMILERDGEQWIYRILRTIGSRHFQYYLGILLSGSVPDDEPRATKDHVLPFGYWIKEKQWVPTVHVFRAEDTDHEEEDPYANLRFLDYDRQCADCHTTPPFSDWLMGMRGNSKIGEYSPRTLYLHAAGLIHDIDPKLFHRGDSFLDYQDREVEQILEKDFANRTAELGIACEACHHGCKEHESKSSPEQSKALPFFSAISPHLRWAAESTAEVQDRSRENVNFICARCHSGRRPMYSNGIHTWNSTEYTDAVNGACYDPAKARAGQMNHLTCITCHDPHKAIGYEWPLTEKQNDQKCLECHQQYRSAVQLSAHTHHGVDSTGSRCMNCHNPRINEGLETMVHTHRIFNPTDRELIEANQPNACNLCHLDKPIDWTITHLRDWYDENLQYSEEKLNANYADRQGPVAAGWLKSSHSGTRLAASSAVTREQAAWAYPLLIELLATDDILVNRQFTQRNLKKFTGLDMKTHGYEFYMEPGKRKELLAQLRLENLLPAKKKP